MFRAILFTILTCLISLSQTVTADAIEYDMFNYSLADLQLRDQMGISQIIRLTGPSQMNVFFEGATEGDADDDDSDLLDEVPAEMTEMNFTGMSGMYGPVEFRLNPVIASMGEMEERTNNISGLLEVEPFALGDVDSFFDVYFEVEIMGQVLHCEVPMRMSGVLYHKPPGATEVYESSQQVELFDAASNPTGIYVTAFRYRPNPVVEVDESDTTLARATLQMPDGGMVTVGLAGTLNTIVFFEGSQEGDAYDDDVDGLGEVEAEIVSINLIGSTSATGTVEVRQSSELMSMGIIEEIWNYVPGLLEVPPFGNGFVDSFFDIYVDLSVGGEYLQNRDPIRASGRFSHKPPPAGETYESSQQQVELYYVDTGEPSGILLGPLELMPSSVVEVDWFEFTLCNVEFITPQGTEYLTFTGHSVNHVFFEGEQEGDAKDDNGNGRDEVYTEIVEMELSATSPLYGPVHLRLRDLEVSSGEIEELVNNTPGRLDLDPFAVGDAENYFNIYFELEVGGQVYHNEQAMHVEGILDHKPANLGDNFVSIYPVELLDELGEETGFTLGLTDCEQNYPEPASDFGDAIDSITLPRYPTLLANNGARHVVVEGIMLGASIDAELDGQPDYTATGDDDDGNDDEDGIEFVTELLTPGKKASVKVEASVNGYLYAWIDFNGDNSWSEPSDQIFNGELLSAGINPLTFEVPLTATPNITTFARFRFTRNLTDLSYDGPCENGEVEDYKVKIKERCGLKWVQRPDETVNGIDIRLDSGDGEFRVMADDFRCESYDLITDVHLWGSWLDDDKGLIRRIELSILSDDPIGPLGSDPRNIYSKPDILLWQEEFFEGDFTEKLYAVVEKGEWWWDAVKDKLVEGGDTQIWEIDIDIDKERAFVQEGTPEVPIIYWLQVRVDTEGGLFGWKTRRWGERFQDNAVWDAGSELPRIWKELRYPEGHPYFDPELNLLDLAFAITTSDYCPADADLNCDGEVNLLDFSIFAEQYLRVIE